MVACVCMNPHMQHCYVVVQPFAKCEYMMVTHAWDTCQTLLACAQEIETQCDWGYSLGVGEWKGASGRFTATPEKLVL